MKNNIDKYNPLFYVNQLKRFPLTVVLVFAIMIVLNLNVAADRSKVLDAEIKIPLARVSIFDRTGKMIGIGDDKGLLPHIYSGAYPQTLRILGYSDKKISSPGDSVIEMIRVAYDFLEVKVDTRRRPILHLTGYLIEFFSIPSSFDTVILHREKWVDFIIPANSEEHFKGWTDPRILIFLMV